MTRIRPIALNLAMLLAAGALRISHGTVAGYPMNGTRAPHDTTLFGLFDRAIAFGNSGEFMLPRRFWNRQDELELSTPANFVTTTDIIGGNSGSPVVDRDGALVRLIFDATSRVWSAATRTTRLGPGRSQSTPATYSRRCGRSTTPAPWRTNCSVDSSPW